jgi:hypothetical protein
MSDQAQLPGEKTPKQIQPTLPATNPQFNFNVKDKKAFANSENIRKALVFLDDKVKNELVGIKDVKGRTEVKDNYYISLYLLNQALGKGEKGPIYKKALPIFNEIKKITRRSPLSEVGFKTAVGNFNRKWDEAHTQTAQKNNAIETAASNAAQELKQSVTAPKEEPVQPTQVEAPKAPEATAGATSTTAATARGTTPNISQAENPKVEAPQVETPTKETPTEPVETPKEPEATDPVKRIKQLKKETSEFIDGIVQKLEGSDDLTAKMALSKVLATKKSFENKMNKYERNAAAGPYSAKKALNFAETDAYIAKNTAHKHTLKGTFRRGVQRTGEAIRSTQQKIKQAGKNIGEKMEKSENLAKIRQTTNTVREKVRAGTEAGVEKVANKIKQKGSEEYNLVNQFLGAQAAKEYNEKPSRRWFLVRQAKLKRNQAVTPTTPQPVQATQPQVAPIQLGNRRTGQKMLPAPVKEEFELARKVLLRYSKY